MPYTHDVPYSEARPPSSQLPFKAYDVFPMHVLVQRPGALGGKGGAAGNGGARGGGEGGRESRPGSVAVLHPHAIARASYGSEKTFPA